MDNLTEFIDFFNMLKDLTSSLPLEFIIFFVLGFFGLVMILTSFSFLFGKKELTNKQSGSNNKNMSKRINKEKIEPYISNIYYDEVTFNHLKINKKNEMNILINKKGVFFIFFDDKIKGKLSGNSDDDYILNKKKQFKNIVLDKKRIIDNFYNDVFNDFNTIIISKNIDTTELIGNHYFSNLNEFHIYLNQLADINSIDNIYKLEDLFPIKIKEVIYE